MSAQNGWSATERQERQEEKATPGLDQFVLCQNVMTLRTRAVGLALLGLGLGLGLSVRGRSR